MLKVSSITKCSGFFGYFQKKTKLTSIGFEVAPLNPLKLILVLFINHVDMAGGKPIVHITKLHEP